MSKPPQATHKHATSAKLSPGGCPTDFFYFAGCPFSDALALASLACWRCWVGIVGFSHLAQELELELGA
eukprot:1157898-Pelagomonas_calceolata.AAC.6